MMLSAFLDLVVIALLIATVVYCFRLNKRLDGLRASQGEMGRLMGDFSRSTERARSAIAELKAAQGQASEALNTNVTRALALRDELAIMTQSADSLAARLERAVVERRNAGQAASPPAAPPPPATATSSDPAFPSAAIEEGLRSAAERELLQALRKVK